MRQNLGIELKSLGLSRNWIIDRAIWHIKRETKWWMLRSANPDIQFSVYFLWFLSLFCVLDESNSDIYEPPIGLSNFSAKIQHRTEWSRQRKLNTHEWRKNSILTSSTDFKFVWWWFINWFHYFFSISSTVGVTSFKVYSESETTNAEANSR